MPNDRIHSKRLKTFTMRFKRGFGFNLSSRQKRSGQQGSRAPVHEGQKESQYKSSLISCSTSEQQKIRISIIFSNCCLTLRVVRWRFLMGYSCLGTSEQGPSRRTRFWSMTSTMAAILPLQGPSCSTATDPIAMNFLKGCKKGDSGLILINFSSC